MGQSQSPDLPPPGGISLDRAQRCSSNAALTAARFHSRSGGRPFKEDYEIECGKILGRGRHTYVVRAHGRINGRPCAVKTFRLWSMTEEQKGLMASEVEVHLALDHPHIARLYDVYESGTDTVYMVMEYCSGGELFAELDKQGHFSEERAAEATWQMLNAICYLHSHDVAHRDIKLENFLFSDSSKRVLKLIDFGFAKVCDGRQKMQAACGTPDYVSPEVLEGNGYTSQCDMWSLGVIVFMLLTGRAPLHAERREQLHRQIKRGEVHWNHLSEHCTVSEEAWAFLRSLLVVNPNDRLTAQMALFHPWLLKTKAERQDSPEIRPSLFRSLRQYAQGPALRRAALQLVVQQLSQEEVQELTRVFMSLSRSGRGTISLEYLRENLDQQMRLFAVCDVNQDGQVYYSDFLSATLSSLEGLREEVLQAAFKRLDLAGTGSLGAGELRAVFGDAFEGIDAEALLAGLVRFGRQPDEGIDFEAFKAVVDGGAVLESADGSPSAVAATAVSGRQAGVSHEQLDFRLQQLDGNPATEWSQRSPLPPVAAWESVH